MICALALVDCKLVRYCNIDVFLLVSHSHVLLHETEICTDLGVDMRMSLSVKNR